MKIGDDEVLDHAVVNGVAIRNGSKTMRKGAELVVDWIKRDQHGVYLGAIDVTNGQSFLMAGETWACLTQITRKLSKKRSRSRM